MSSPESDNDPRFLSLSFEDEPAVKLVSSRLHTAWKINPGLTSDASIDDRMAEFIRTDPSEYEGSVQYINPDDADSMDDIHTEWRQKIIEMYNHVWWDVSTKLAVGRIPKHLHFHPPTSEILTIQYPPPDASALAMTFGANAFLYPAYVAPNVILRADTPSSSPDEESQTLGSFDDSHSTNVWFVKKGEAFMLSVEGAWTKDADKILRDGGPNKQRVAGVFAIASLCEGEGENTGIAAAEEEPIHNVPNKKTDGSIDDLD